MAKVQLGDILEMSIAERILLVEEVWDSIAAEPDAVPLTEEQRAELDRRLAACEKEPEAGAPWSEVKTRLLNES